MMAPGENPGLEGPQLERAPEATQEQKLAWEKELLGIYLSDHPFARAAENLGTILTCSIVELNAEFSGREVIIGGLVSGSRQLTTKDGRSFLAAEIEDLTGSVEVTVWPETYESTREIWTAGNIVVVAVRIRENNDRLQMATAGAAVGHRDLQPAGAAAGRLPQQANRNTSESGTPTAMATARRVAGTRPGLRSSYGSRWRRQTTRTRTGSG
jgi:DNA polymerase-3 subunit alpha